MSRYYSKGKQSVDLEWNAIDCRDWLNAECATQEEKRSFMQGRRDAQSEDRINLED